MASFHLRTAPSRFRALLLETHRSSDHWISLATLSPAIHNRDNDLAGVLSLVAGIAVFSVQDVIIKLISGVYPVYEAITIRSLVALPILWVMVAVNRRGATLRSRHWRLLLVRGVIMFFSYTVYYLALAALPLATCIGLYFAAPLFITVMSALFLREQVGLRRWAAVLMGFVGVLIILRPGTEVFEVAALLPIFSALTYGMAQVLARKLGEEASASVMTFYANGMYILGGIAMVVAFGGGDYQSDVHKSWAFLTRGWKTPSLDDFLLMAACGVIAAVGLTLLSHAYRSSRASTIAPFEYSAIVLSVAYGWFIWGEFPDMVSWVGIAIVIGAGMYVVAVRDRALTRG
ncbi:DMT family transporter [Mesorhizobium sp. CN2-181]|uniref:DMT family transporter n=1 Tax=Mesorhizobium yinganensis TaxID=3157707 RepID=UPI0032B85E81